MHLHVDNRTGGRNLCCLAVCFAGCKERNGESFTLEKCKCFTLLDDHITGLLIQLSQDGKIR